MILSKIQCLLFFAGLVAATMFDNIAKPLVRNVNLRKMAMKTAHAFSKGELQATAGLKAASSSDYYVITHYGTEGCSDDSMFYASSFDVGFCINIKSDGQKFSFKPVCSDDGYAYEFYQDSGCKSSNIALSIVLFPISEECALYADLFDDDDDDDFDDDDLFGGMTYYTGVCTNTIDSSLTDVPGVAYYYGSDCDKERIGIDYYPETECSAAGTGSVSVTCGDELDLVAYAGSTTCSSDPQDDAVQTGKCMSAISDDDGFADDDDDDDDDDDNGGDDDDDDDDFDDDDDDFDDDDGLAIISSMYASCKSSDLPDAAFHAFTSVWTAIITSIAVGMALVKHA